MYHFILQSNENLGSLIVMKLKKILFVLYKQASLSSYKLYLLYTDMFLTAQRPPSAVIFF